MTIIKPEVFSLVRVSTLPYILESLVRIYLKGINVSVVITSCNTQLGFIGKLFPISFVSKFRRVYKLVLTYNKLSIGLFL